MLRDEGTEGTVIIKSKQKDTESREDESKKSPRNFSDKRREGEKPSG